MARPRHVANGKIEEVEAKHKHLTFLADWRRLPRRTKVITVAALSLLVLYGLIFFIPKHVTYAYSGHDCARQLTLFPGIMKQSSDQFDVAFDRNLTVGNVTIASLETCFTAKEVPSTDTVTVSVAPWGGFLASKQYRLDIQDPPRASVGDLFDQTVPTTRPVEIKLSAPDAVHTYTLDVDEKSVDCPVESDVVKCNLSPLELNQGETYDGVLARYFEDEKIDELGSGKFTTLRPLVLAYGTVSPGLTVYDKPKSFSFEYDKDISHVEAQLKKKVGDIWEDVAVTTSADGKKAIVSIESDLDRSAEYELRLVKVEAADGSAIPEPYVADFITSSGPAVMSISVGSTGVALGGTITLTFDQEIANTDRLKELVTFSGFNATISHEGKNVYLSYSAGRCADFSVSVKKGLESTHGIAQEADWNFSGRTLCYSVFSIGTSKQGRSIVAYSFGSGGKKILYTGAIHGNEQGTRLLMNAWINELDANARSIPAGVTIVVIPAVNPDGVAMNSRYNASNVDLNRNFNTGDWKSDVETPYGQPHPGGGGSAPESEPEARALAAYTRQLRPAFTMSYHSVAGYAIANTCGNSTSLVQEYSRLSGYRNMTGVSSAFDYEITGTYDDWMCQEMGLASILVELSTNGNSEFNRNRAALWMIARS